jgi:uncharacterized protein
VAGLLLKRSGSGVSLTVRITPRAARAAIGGEHAGALKVSVTAPPSDGEANAALIEQLAAALDIPKSAIEITHGHAHRLKTVHIEGVSEDAITALAALKR